MCQKKAYGPSKNIPAAFASILRQVGSVCESIEPQEVWGQHEVLWSAYGFSHQWGLVQLVIQKKAKFRCVENQLKDPSGDTSVLLLVVSYYASA